MLSDREKWRSNNCCAIVFIKTQRTVDKRTVDGKEQDEEGGKNVNDYEKIWKRKIIVRETEKILSRKTFESAEKSLQRRDIKLF